MSRNFRVVMLLISRIVSPAHSGRGGYSFSMVRPTIIEIISLRVMSLTSRVAIDVPVTHDGHHVAEAEDLVQLVRDVDDRDALALQVVDDL